MVFPSINPVNFGLNLAEVCPSTENMLRTEIRTAWYLGPGGTLAQETESSTRNAMCFDVSRHEVASVGKLVGSSLGSEEWQEFLANIFLTDK